MDQKQIDSLRETVKVAREHNFVPHIDGQTLLDLLTLAEQAHRLPRPRPPRRAGDNHLRVSGMTSPLPDRLAEALRQIKTIAAARKGEGNNRLLLTIEATVNEALAASVGDLRRARSALAALAAYDQSKSQAATGAERPTVLYCLRDGEHHTHIFSTPEKRAAYAATDDRAHIFYDYRLDDPAHYEERHHGDH